MALLDKFPGIPRDQQALAIPRIEDAIKKGVKYIIIQGPTGSGKSHIGATLAYSTRSIKDGDRISDGGRKFGAFVLTITTQLQDQYNNLFPDSTILKGKSNYICQLDGMSTCDHALCMLDRSVINKCLSNAGCLYYDAYKDALRNKFSILNYNMFLSLPEDYRHRDILICDEATELENALISMHSVDINYEFISNLYKIPISPLKNDTPAYVFNWLTGFQADVKYKLAEISSKIQNSKKKSPSTSDINLFTRVKELSEKLNVIINTWYNGCYVIELNKDGVKLSPLHAKNVSNSIFNYGDTIILMSATICNHRKFADTLGIKANEYCFIDIPSDFDPKVSPIYTASARHDLTYANISKNLPSMVKDICEICEIHQNENGIIHTHNFNILSAVKKAVGKNSRFLFREDGANNDDLLFEHYVNPNPTVIVSPSLSFGTSLDNEFGRFQIICKLPYLPLGDKRISILSKMDQEWYTMKMLITLIQASGRCTRSKDDHSKTYIMDKSFMDVVIRNEKIIPPWFIARIM